MPTQLSVNINKLATLRNSRGNDVPNLLEGVRTILAAGARGITIHPRADERHITHADIYAIARELAPARNRVELNIEGDPRPDLMDIVCEVRPHQCTLVPVRPGEITSEAGWDPATPVEEMRALVSRLKAADIRVSVFINADPKAVRWAAELDADRVELYTEPFARAFSSGPEAVADSVARFAKAATTAHQLGLGVNAGHDLDLDNLPRFQDVPHVLEVSIGHALIARALYVGLSTAVREYLAVLAAPAGASL